MRKIYTLFAAITTALSTLTVSAVSPARHLQKAPTIRKDVPSAPIASRGEEGGIMSLPWVTTLPEDATVKVYSRNCEMLYLDMVGLIHTDDYGASATVAYSGENVYISNSFGGSALTSYLVGKVSDNTITVDFPQKVDVQVYDDATYTYFAYALTYEENDGKYKMNLAEEQSVTFSITENGIKQDGDNFISLFLAEPAVNDKGEEGYNVQFSYFADRYIELTEVNDKPTTLPETVNKESWVLKSEEGMRIIDVAIENNDFYIGGLFTDIPQAAIKGTIEGDKVTFARNQYMGISDYYLHHAYFIPATYEYHEETDDYEAEYTFEAKDDIVFSYDKEAKTLTTEEGQSMVFSAITAWIYYIETYNDPMLFQQDNSTALVPADPQIMSIEDFFDDLDFYTICYTLPLESTDGRVLDKNKYHYNIFLDDEVYTVVYEDYDETEEFTDIPYDYEDFQNMIWMGDYVEGYVWATGFDKVGIQAFYDNGDGNITSSNVVYIDVASVGNVTASAEVVNTEYFDITGRKVSGNERGLKICRHTMSDGSVKVVKVMK